MRIYYRSNSLCGKKNGNGKKIPLLNRLLYSLCSTTDLQPFSLEEINSVFFNKHQSIGCSIDAPLKFVGWQSESQWYKLFKSNTIFLPMCISFSNGAESYNIVVINDEYELRIWPESHCTERTQEQWFSHEPIVHDTKLEQLKTSFYVLLDHIKKEDSYIS